MASTRNPLSKIRLVIGRSSVLVKCVVLTTIVLCTAALLVLRFAIADTKEQKEAKRTEAAALEHENNEWENSIKDLGTLQGIKDLAGKLLGLVDPDTVIILPEQ